MFHEKYSAKVELYIISSSVRSQYRMDRCTNRLEQA